MTSPILVVQDLHKSYGETHAVRGVSFQKDRGQLAVLFALPLLFSLIFGGPYALMEGTVVSGGEPTLSIKAYVVNEDQGPYGEQVEAVLRAVRPLRLQRSRTVDQADEMVADGEAAAAIIIPADFSSQLDANQPASVELTKDPTQQAEAQIVAGILNEAQTELSVRAEVAYGIRAVYEKIGVLEAAGPESVRAAQAQTMGTMFAFFLVGYIAESVLKEREGGSFRRLLAAPIHRGTVVAGKMLAFIGVVFLQMVVLFGIGYALFEMPLGDSPLGLLALTLALALAATGLGMLVGSIVRTSKEAGSIGLVLGFVLFFASGSIGSISVSGEADLGFRSEGLRFYISQLTPHAHAFDGYFKLILEGDGLVDILPNVVAPLGFAVVFFLVAMWRFKFN